MNYLVVLFIAKEFVRLLLKYILSLLQSKITIFLLFYHPGGGDVRGKGAGEVPDVEEVH